MTSADPFRRWTICIPAVFMLFTLGCQIDYKIGAYYYPWYYNDFHGGHYLRERLVPTQQPALGEYNDRDEAVIGQHLAWSHAGNVSFWAASWWGPGSREDVTLLDHILVHPDLGDFEIAILYETTGRTYDFTDYSNLGPDVAYLAEHYFDHPNYLTIDGRPALFVYLTRVMSHNGTLESSMNAMRAAASAVGFDLYVVGDQVFGSPPGSPGEIALLDAITNYDVYGSMGAAGYAGQGRVDDYYAAQAGWKIMAGLTGAAFIPAITPGFNDRAVREGHDATSRMLTAEAEFGSLFRAMIRGAKKHVDRDVGNMIMVTTWNEWHEDTQIEPTNTATPTSLDDSGSGDYYTQGLSYEGYGERYLEILGEET